MAISAVMHSAQLDFNQPPECHCCIVEHEIMSYIVLSFYIKQHNFTVKLYSQESECLYLSLIGEMCVVIAACTVQREKLKREERNKTYILSIYISVLEKKTFSVAHEVNLVVVDAPLVLV